MPRIDCGPGKVFNPNSGKCIQREGATAKKLEKFGTQLNQSGECNGAVKRGIKSGVPYCAPTTVYVHPDMRGPSTRANAAKRNIERQKREIDELKRLRTQNAKEIKRISLEVKRIERRIGDTPQGTKRMRDARDVRDVRGRNGQPDRPTKRPTIGNRLNDDVPQGTKRTRDVRGRDEQPNRPTKRPSIGNRLIDDVPQGTKRTRDVRGRDEQPNRPTKRPMRPAQLL